MPPRRRTKRRGDSDEEYDEGYDMEEKPSDEDEDNLGGDDGLGADEDAEDREFGAPRMEEVKPKQKSKGKSRYQRNDYDDDLELLEENKESARTNSRLKKGRLGNRFGSAFDDDAEFDDEDDDFIDDSNFKGAWHRDERSYFHDFYDTQQAEVFESKVDLTQIYEPDEIKERFATVEDERIKTLDMPERFQLRYANRENPTNEELHEETIWIYNKFAYELHLDLARRGSKPDLMELIFKVLNLIRVQNYEVMYIYHYEFLRHFPIEGFTIDHLWEIYDLDMDWNAIYRRKNAIRKLLDIVENINAVDPFIREHLESCQDLQSLQDLQDFAEYTMVKFKVEQQALGGGQYKRPTRSNFISEAMRYRLDELSSQVAISPDEFAHNLENKAKKTGATQWPDFYRDLPEDAIKRYINPKVPFLENSLKCLYSIVSLMARDLFYHPIVRKILRKEYLELNVRLITNPTEKGKKDLDIYHPHFFVKRMRVTRPLKELRDDTWLVVLEEERKNRIEVKFEFEWGDDDTKDIIKQNLMELYLSPMRGLSPEEQEITAKWNIFRSEVIKTFLDEFMYLYLEKWIRQELHHRAERQVVKTCGRKFRDLINRQPYKGELEKKGRVLAAMPESNRGPVAFAMIDINGEVLDRFVLYSLNYLNFVNNNQDHVLADDISRERKRIKTAIQKFKPNLLVIGATYMECFYLKTHLNTLIESLVEELKSERAGDYSSIWVDLADPALAQLYSKSEQSIRDFSEDTTLMRGAISLGRYHQDPAAETLTLWDEDPNKNLLTLLRFHSQQERVDYSRLLNEYEKVAMEVISTTGVDINLILKYQHLRAPLQFVSGLGPRKSLYLIQNIIDRCEMLNYRFQLCSAKILSKNVYDNCAGFIKVRLFSRSDTNYDVLDSTRIHPIHYEITRRIAKVLVRSSSDRDDLVQRIMENPHQYLHNLEDKRRVLEFEGAKSKWNWSALISFIKAELTHAYQDVRPKMTTLGYDPAAQFYVLAKENQEGFREGSLVTARVTKINQPVGGGEKGKDGIVMCRLDCGVLASIHENDLSTKFQDMKVGIYIRARIKRIIHKSVHVYLSIKDVSDHDYYYALIHSKLKTVNCEVIRAEDFPATMEATHTGARFRPRNIRHAAFKNISIAKAIDYLNHRELGSFVIRPSSKGLDHLSLTWKFFDGVFVHLDIKEEDKQPGAIISNKLRIGNEIYQDLDEIIKMYIEPCNILVRHCIKHKKFIRAPLERVEETLRDDRKNNPKVNAYYFCFASQAPHYLLLCYLNQHMNLVAEFIKIKPRGLYFHEQFFPNLTEIITWMKQNFYTDVYQRFVRKAKLPIVLDHKPVIAEPPRPLRERSQSRAKGQGSEYRRRDSAKRSEPATAVRKIEAIDRPSAMQRRSIPSSVTRPDRFGGQGGSAEGWGSAARLPGPGYDRSRSRSTGKRPMPFMPGPAIGYGGWAVPDENFGWGMGGGFGY